MYACTLGVTNIKFYFPYLGSEEFADSWVNYRDPEPAARWDGSLGQSQSSSSWAWSSFGRSPTKTRQGGQSPERKDRESDGQTEWSGQSLGPNKT